MGWVIIEASGLKASFKKNSHEEKPEMKKLEEESKDATTNSEQIPEEKSHSHGGKLDLSMIKDLKDSLVILVIANLMFGAQSYFMFTQMSTECFVKRFGLTLEEAKNRLFLMPLIATASIPFYSFLVGRVGKKVLLLSTGYALVLISYILMINLP